MIMKSKILPLIFLAVILLSCGEDKQAPEVGNPAPSLSLPDLNGESVSLESLKGKVVIMNLWTYT
jgi:hypothetical protein